MPAARSQPAKPLAPSQKTARGHWLVKQEPTAYPWSQFVADRGTTWTGVRNYQARLNLRAMRVGDPVLYYHSVTEKAVVGVAEVAREAYPDPTAPAGEDWSCVDLRPARELATPVTLEWIKSDPALRTMVLLRNSRLSVQPLTAAEFARIIEIADIRA